MIAFLFFFFFLLLRISHASRGFFDQSTVGTWKNRLHGRLMKLVLVLVRENFGLDILRVSVSNLFTLWLVVVFSNAVL